MTATTLSTTRPSAADLAAATPASRERYVDLLRAVSILVVVLGHWLMAVIERNDGEVQIGNVLAITPHSWLLTWLLQVMPIFFFVGGFSNAVAIESMRRKGRFSYGAWASSRANRLMRPVAVLLALWVPLIVVLELTPIGGATLRSATTLVSQPLWFIGIYLIVCALAPLAHRAYRRFGSGSIVALGCVAALVDVVRFALGLDGIGYCNFVFVWLFAQQLGFAYADGSLRRWGRASLVAMAVGGLTALALLVTVGPYPLSMVGMPGEKISNMAPPTVCLVALTVWQVALVMLARDRVSAWLNRPRVWTATVVVNASIMTIFCWHLSAALALTGGLLAVGAPFPTGGSLVWWLTRPLWIAVLTVLLLAFVAGFGRFERPSTSGSKRVPGNAVGVIGIIVLIVGVCGVAWGGLTPLFESKPLILGVIGGGPAVTLGEVILGAALLGLVPRLRIAPATH